MRYISITKIAKKNCYKCDKKLLQILQKIVTKVGATNEQTKHNKVQDKNKTKFLY